MKFLNKAGIALVGRAIKAHEMGTVGFAKEIGVSHIKLMRLLIEMRGISSEEMASIAEGIGWPMKYIVLKK